jgi:hypothetical protein
MRIAAFAAVLGGCGGSSPPESGSWTIPIDRGKLSGGPALLAVRDGDVWQALDPMATEVTVHHRAFVLLAGCTYTSSSTTRSLVASDARTVDDPLALRLACVDTMQTQPATVTVSGQMVQAGELCDYFNGCSTDNTANWSYSFTAVHAGVPETLIATDQVRVAIYRDLVFDQATMRPVIDLTIDGQPLATFAVGLDGLAGETVFASETIAIHGSSLTQWASIGTSDALPIVPQALLAPDDVHQIEILVGNNGDRFVDITSHDLTDVQPRYQLLPALAGITLSPHAASWSSLPDGVDAVELDESAKNARAVARVSLDFLAGATSVMTDYSAAPGYDPTWSFTPTAETLTASENFGDTAVVGTRTH